MRNNFTYIFLNYFVMHIYIGCLSTQQELRTVYAKFHDAARDKSEIELHNYLQDKA